MNGILNSIFGIIEVVELDNVITVSGIRSSILVNNIRKYLDSSRLTNNMFDYGSHSFSFHSFFAPDVLFTIKKLIDAPTTNISVHTLFRVEELLLENTYLKRIKETTPKLLDRSKLKNLHKTPLDYQEELFDLYEKNHYAYNLSGFLFAGTAGSGKTYTSLALAECLDVDQVIVVCPIAALRRVWEDNIVNQFKTKKTYWISDSNKDFKGDEQFIIVHYEYLEKLLDQLYRLKGKKIMVIPDESHNLNETTASRTNLFISLCKRVQSKHVLWLSGTPIKALALESIPLIRCIDPLFTIDAEERFKRIFKGDNTKAVEILNNRIGLISFKVGKERLNLAAPIFHTVNVAFKGSEKYTLVEIKKQMQLFIRERKDFYEKHKEENHLFFFECLKLHEEGLNSDQARSQFYLYQENLDTIANSSSELGMIREEILFCNRYELREIIPNLPTTHAKRFKEVKSIYKYVHLKIQGECLGLVVARARINCHIDISKYIDYEAIIESTKKKTVIFSSFTEVVEEAERTLKKLEFIPITVYGKTSGLLNESVAKFEKQKNINPLIATYATLATAVPLVMSDTMLLIDSPFRDYILQQAVSRIHRLGSDTQTHVYITALDTGALPNISTRTTDILKWSQEQTAEILGIKSPFELQELGADKQVVIEDSTNAIRIVDEIESYVASIEGIDLGTVVENYHDVPILEWDKDVSKNKDVYYHGSSSLIDGYLEPRPSRVINNKEAVFATDIASIALSFIGEWRDDSIQQGTINGRPYLREMKKGAFNEFFKGKEGYVYIVTKAGFETAKGLTKYEFINDKKVKILAAYYVKDVLKALMEEDIDMIPYGQLTF